MSCTCARCVFTTHERVETMLAIRGHFVMSHEEAEEKEIIQIGKSACGATAVLNALNGLRWNNLPSNEEADQAVGTRQRKLKSPLQDYLLSRSDAGATHEDLLKGMVTLTSGKVVGRFFHMFPSRPQDLFQWMVRWMEMGAVLVASLNLQKEVPEGMPIPDAWHHQMIYGVIESGVFTLNPHEFIPFTTLIGQLSSESTIMIQAEDIAHRWLPKADMSLISNGRWADLAVTQNISKLIYLILTRQPHDSHVTIPASYKSGITVFCTKDSDAGRTILCQQ